MDKSVRNIIIRLFLVITLFVCSIPLWFGKNKELGLAYAAPYENTNIKVDIDYFKSLLVIDDNQAFSVINPTKVSLTNTANDTKFIDFVFLVSKTSTVDYHDLRVSLNDTIYNLNELEMSEDQDNYYFVLDTMHMTVKQIISYAARIWINPTAGVLPNTTSLTTNFVCIEK